MAKFIFRKKIKEKPPEKEDNPVKEKKKIKKANKKELWNKTIAIAGNSIEAVDEICDEIGKIADAGWNLLISICASLVNAIDLAGDIAEWFVLKVLVISGRKLHDGRLRVIEHKRAIIKDASIIVLAITGMVGVYAWATDYEYSYNGRPLGIVKEQSDVLEILDIVNDELSMEYGTNIQIDPETDITFRPVVSYGREIDSSDQVLRRFTYMDEIQTEAYAIKSDGEVIAIVESEQVANNVLEEIRNIYTKKDDDVEYEYVGFVEDVTIEPYSTKLTNVSSFERAVESIRSGGQEATVYTVVEGDSLYGICDKLGVSLSQLQEMNPGLSEDTMLHVGDTLNSQEEIPLLTVETIEVSTMAESIPYETEYQESDAYYEGETYVSRSGSNGRASVTARLTKHNGQVVEREDLSTEVIIEPVNEIIIKGTREVPPTIGTGTFIRPVSVGIYAGYGYRWGRMHEGIDLAASTGTPIRAADGGTVTKAGWHNNYGYMIIINHGANTQTLYAHCSQLLVSAGQKVYQGQTIGLVGNTGRSTGPHCHFEIHINGRTVNPANYV